MRRSLVAWAVGAGTALALFAASGMEAVTLDLPAGGKPGTRAYQDIPITPEFIKGGALGFDVTVTDPLVISTYVCYFHSGKGWYKARFEPTADDVEANRRYRVTLSTADVLETEGEPAGWGAVDSVRFAAYRGSPKPSRVVLDRIAGETVRHEVLFIRGDTGNDTDTPYLTNMRSAFESLGFGTLAIGEKDVRPAAFDGVRLVVLAYSPRLADATCAEIERFVAKGGKLFAAYTIPPRIAKLLAVEAVAHVRPNVDGLGALAGFVASDSPLAGQPKFSPQASWMCTRMRPLKGAQVAAWWRTTDGKVTDIPGLVVSPNGAYISHVWLGAQEREQLDFFAAAVDRCLPGTRKTLWEARAKLAREAAAQRAEMAAMPGKPGERRFIWCHSAWGMGGANDWDSSCRFAKENGFTDLLVNLAWGGCAYYPSKVLPRAEQGPRGDALAACKAACRRHGLKMHVWKVCWNQCGRSPRAFHDAMVAEGRMAVRFDGTADPKWNCPSDPRNRELEIATMAELAFEKGVDGVHFDYIRYDSRNVCFCERCRRLFEKQIGRAVAKWPQDVNLDPALAKEWTRFRCGNIAAVVKAVAERVHGAKLPVEVSAAVFPNCETTADDVGQDWVSWCRAGWLDFVCPMDYIRRPKQFAVRVAAQRDALRGMRTRLYPGIAIDCSMFNQIGSIIPAREIMAVRAAGLDGFTLFHLGNYAVKALPELRAGPLKEVKNEE